MSDVDRASTPWGWPELRMSRLGGLSVLAALTSLGAAALCLWLEVAMTWPILVAGLGSSALASVVDMHERRLPDVVVIPATVAVGVLVVAGRMGEDSWARAWTCLGTATLSGVIFTVVCFAMPAQLGLGDAKLAVLLALTTAWLSPTAPLWAFVSGFALAGVWAAVMLLRGRHGRTDLPLGPFLTLGSATSVSTLLAG